MHLVQTRDVAAWCRTRRHWVRKIAVFIVLGLACAWAYGWASLHLYPASARVGFGHGFVHGAMMPMALPGLLLGKDPVIYAETNTGRTYKLGYVFGINVCGLVFFGLAFWRPRDRSAPVGASSNCRPASGQ